MVKQHNVYTTSRCCQSSRIKKYSYYRIEAKQNRNLQWKTDINISQSVTDWPELNKNSRWTIRHNFLFLETREGNKEFPVFVMKNEIPFKFPNGRSCIYLRNVKNIDSPPLWKISLQLQATNHILENSRENFINLDFVLVWDWR